MDNLNPLIFLTPVIALILAVLLFIHLVKARDDNVVFKCFVLITLVLAFIFNFAWELLQMPLYKDAPYTFTHIAFCALASVADAIMVLLIYLFFGVIYKNTLWVKDLKLPRILTLILCGAIGAIIAETRHVSAGNWTYDNSMPIIPIIEVGLSPVLQFMLLPLLIYYLSYKKSKKYNGPL